MGTPPRAVIERPAWILAVAAALLVTACSTTGCSGFAASLATDHGGQPSPVAAAEWFSGHGGVGGLPRSGWREDGRDQNGATVRSGDTKLHAIQGSDKTWQVDSGTSC
jgi:hypothetical protein